MPVSGVGRGDICHGSPSAQLTARRPSRPALTGSPAGCLSDANDARDLSRTRIRASAIIDTSFTMDVGETVVVGTSRVRGGDKALIALLTAVPKGTTLKRED